MTNGVKLTFITHMLCGIGWFYIGNSVSKHMYSKERKDLFTLATLYDNTLKWIVEEGGLLEREEFAKLLEEKVNYLHIAARNFDHLKVHFPTNEDED